MANFKRLQTRRVVFAFGISYDATADQVAEVPQLVRLVLLELLCQHLVL